MTTPRPTTTKESLATGFTLIEVMVTTMLIAIAVTAVMGGIRSLQVADQHARNMDLLQRLASEKLEDVASASDPATYGTSGDYQDRGYPDATWTVDLEASSAANVSQVTVTARRGKDSEELTQYIYIQPVTTNSTTTTTQGGTGGGGGGGV